MALSQLERDLRNYAQERVAKTVQDVVESFAIAGIVRGEALACLGAITMKVSAVIAAASGVPKVQFLHWCAEAYDKEPILTTNRKKESDNG
jgi:hypothetical protein